MAERPERERDDERVRSRTLERLRERDRPDREQVQEQQEHQEARARDRLAVPREDDEILLEEEGMADAEKARERAARGERPARAVGGAGYEPGRAVPLPQRDVRVGRDRREDGGARRGADGGEDDAGDGGTVGAERHDGGGGRGERMARQEREHRAQPLAYGGRLGRGEDLEHAEHRPR